MSALVLAALAISAPPAPAASPSAAADNDGFAALLGEMTDPKSPSATQDKEAKPPDAASAEPSTVSPLQSLEAALAALGGFNPTPNAPSPQPAKTPDAKAGSRTGTAPAPSASPLSTALKAAATAFEATAADANGAKPLKAVLQADPTLGVGDFSMKTFLAAAGAAPMRAGVKTLSADSAWSPLPSPDEAPTLAVVAETAKAPATPSALGPTLRVASAAAAPAVIAARAATVVIAVEPAPAAPGAPAVVATPPTPTALAVIAASPPPAAPAASASPPIPAAPRASAGRPAPPPAAARSQAPSPIASASSDDGSPHNGADKAAVAPAAPPHGKDAPAVVAPASPDARPIVTVPLADLPAFIATQASALMETAAPDAQSATASAPAATAKAAQAVKELNISLDPADLGPMTLKLRLAGGKMSVTIAIANPQTLASIEDDRALIAARLSGVDQSLGDLVIQRQAAAPQETAPAHASDSGSTSSADSDSPSNLADDEAGASRRRGGQPGGGFGGFV